jgi:hypothetical protein
VALALLAPAGAAQAQGRPATATITRVTGRVEVLRHGQTTWAPATVGGPLAERDEIRAFGGGSALLQLPDSSTVFLAENGRLVVTKLEVDPRRQTRNAILHVVVGKVRAIVTQAAILLVQTRQSNFAITTPTAVAAARGTDYVVMYNLAQRSTGEATLSGEVLCYDLMTRTMVVVPLKRRTLQCGLPFEFSAGDEADYVSPRNPFSGQPSDDPTAEADLVSPADVDQILAGQPPLAALGLAPTFTLLDTPSGAGPPVPQAPQSFPPVNPVSSPPSPSPGPAPGITPSPPSPFVTPPSPSAP